MYIYLGMILALVSPGSSISITSNLPNNTQITHQVGERNILVECEVFDDNSTQLITEWNFADVGFQCTYEVQYVLTNARIGFSFDNTSYHNRLIIKEYSALFDRLILLCGKRSNPLSSNLQFPLRLYCEYFVTVDSEK